MTTKVGKQTKKSSGKEPASSAPSRVAHVLDQLLVAKDRDSKSRKVKDWLRRRRMYLFGASVVAIVCMAAVFATRSRPQSIDEPVQQSPQISVEDPVEDVVRRYGADYDTSLQNTARTNPTEWSSESLDEAYFSLLYADKTGAFTQVYALLSLIESAEQAGMDIDSNAYSIDQHTRDAIKHRADAHARAAKGGGQERGNNE